jgi:hypothetical protein
MEKKPPSVIASGLLARAGGAPARATPIEDLPRPAVAAADERTGGIKQATIGTTVYLLPDEHKRLKRLALDLDLPTVHELLLTGIDRLLRERGEPPLVRYSAPRARKGQLERAGTS